MIHKRILVFLIAFLPVIISSCSDDDDTPTVGTVEDVNGEFTGNGAKLRLLFHDR